MHPCTPRTQACTRAHPARVLIRAPLHRYEVGSGLLVAPGVPGIAERQDMQKLIGTYGKTWHMWQVDRGDPLPYGGCGNGQVRGGVGSAHGKMPANGQMSSACTSHLPISPRSLPSAPGRSTTADDGFH